MGIVLDLAELNVDDILVAGEDWGWCMFCGCHQRLAEEPAYHEHDCIWRRAKRLVPDPEPIREERQFRMRRELAGVSIRTLVRIRWGGA